MPNLTDLIRVVPSDREEEVEDIYASAAYLIFPDDTRTNHGDPGSFLVYQSRRFGHIELSIADPEREDERQLFSHYLWNAGIKLAELVVMTDYPAPVVLANIRRNAGAAIPERLEQRYSVEGHEWGELDTVSTRSHAHRFPRIMAADCYWMTGQHHNLVRSMLHFLSLDSSGRIFATAGFHTGRAKLAAFFEVAVAEGLEIEEIYEEDVAGVRRPWETERAGGREDVMERKRWLVIARLKRRLAKVG
ncbi:hypothetical protein LTR53_004024 [Teratosphaeriaceae sp. CCFEE 6253]|nr:hypothetical protein LTR53_004024 [Teratosphaeriaceae sp. CCFEE 6253]